MKKTIVAFCMTFLLCAQAFSQASLTTTSYNKKDQSALLLQLPYSEDVAEGFIVANLKKVGYEPESKGSLFWKSNKVNGYYVYKNVRLEGLHNGVDLYFKVEPKSRKEKDQSVIYLLMSKEGENFVSSGSDPDIIDAGKSFMNGFVEQSAVYKLDLDVKNQEKAVKDAEHKLSKLKDEEQKLNKKLEQLQKDIKQNLEDQDAQQKTIESERQKLEVLKGNTSQ
jgi:hypothetical protein